MPKSKQRPITTTAKEHTKASKRALREVDDILDEFDEGYGSEGEMYHLIGKLYLGKSLNLKIEILNLLTHVEQAKNLIQHFGPIMIQPSPHQQPSPAS